MLGTLLMWSTAEGPHPASETAAAASAARLGPCTLLTPAIHTTDRCCRLLGLIASARLEALPAAAPLALPAPALRRYRVRGRRAGDRDEEQDVLRLAVRGCGRSVR